jgi:hypothetical protein
MTWMCQVFYRIFKPSPLLTAFAIIAAMASMGGRASAIPVFAHRYGLSCQACHTIVPHLTGFGEIFLANGYRMPGVKPKAAFPAAVRVEINYASAGAADPDAIKGPLPKTIVNEVQLLIGGAVGSRGSYWIEPYFISGGFPGVARDAWYAQRLTDDGAQIPITVRAGQFTLPLPLDPETFRETIEPYAVWGQTAGANPFNFFSPKIGTQVEIGDPSRAMAATVSLLKGADQQSGLPTRGTDSMITLERDLGDFALTAYRYDGSRLVSGNAFNSTQYFTGIGDRFWRNGLGAGWKYADTEVDADYQIGNDTAADVYGDDLVTSGGFLQVRQALNARTFAIARWDATSGPTVMRSVTAGAGYRVARNMRLTLFETGQRTSSGTLLHIISSSLLFAY